MPLDDPYASLPDYLWPQRTVELLDQHPLTGTQVVDAVLEAWERILLTRVAGAISLREAKPSPQLLGSYLHLVLPLVLNEIDPGNWRQDRAKHEKDLVYLPDDFYSTELKTSSAKGKVFGNRSAAQPPGPGAKDSMGYYICVNTGRFTSESDAKITYIQWGWISRADWRGQAAATGQQASLSPAVYAGKMVRLY